MANKDFTSLLKLAILSDVILIHASFYKQNKGLAMGNNLSPLLAIIYMNFIEQKILNSPNTNITLWRRYIDDIFVISLNPLDDLLPTANSFSSNIQFTLECSSSTNHNNDDNNIPFLDTLVTFSHRDHQFKTSLYSKPMHSNATLPWASYVPLHRKLSALRTERLRAKVNSTSASSFQQALLFLKHRFVLNGFPSSVIDQYLMNDCARNLQNHCTLSKKIIYMKFPFLGETFCSKVKSELAKADLPVRIRPIFKTCAPLSVQLRKVSPMPCGRSCICGGRSLCFTKNIIYEIYCNLCRCMYIGETYRTLRSRICEHLSPHNKSNVYEHFKTSHNMVPSMQDISFKIRHKGFDNSLQRKCKEAEIIRIEKPLINVQFNR